MDASKIVAFFGGVGLAVVLVAAGVGLTILFETGAFIYVPVFSVPVLGFYCWRYKNKQLGIGMFVTSVPLIGFAILLMMFSGITC